MLVGITVKVVVNKRNKNYLRNGGKFLSVFPMQENSLIGVATKDL